MQNSETIRSKFKMEVNNTQTKWAQDTKAIPVESEIIPSSDSEVDVSSAEGFDTKATRRLLRKLDFRLVPFLALLYLFEIPSQPSSPHC